MANQTHGRLQGNPSLVLRYEQFILRDQALIVQAAISLKSFHPAMRQSESTELPPRICECAAENRERNSIGDQKQIGGVQDDVAIPARELGSLELR